MSSPSLTCRVRDDRKGKVEAGADHAKRTLLRGLRFEDLDDCPGLPRPLGAALGRHPHPRHQAPSSRHVRRGEAGPRPVARSSRFATASTATAASRSRPPTTGCRGDGIGRRIHVQWNVAHVRLLAPTPASSSASTCARREGAIASRPETGPHAPADHLRPARCPQAGRSRAIPDHIHRHDGPLACATSSASCSRQEVRSRRRRRGRHRRPRTGRALLPLPAALPRPPARRGPFSLR